MPFTDVSDARLYWKVSGRDDAPELVPAEESLLESDGTAEALIDRLVDCSHSSLADHPDYSVAILENCVRNQHICAPVRGQTRARPANFAGKSITQAVGSACSGPAPSNRNHSCSFVEFV